MPAFGTTDPFQEIQPTVGAERRNWTSRTRVQRDEIAIHGTNHDSLTVGTVLSIGPIGNSPMYETIERWISVSITLGIVGPNRSSCTGIDGCDLSKRCTHVQPAVHQRSDLKQPRM